MVGIRLYKHNYTVFLESQILLSKYYKNISVLLLFIIYIVYINITNKKETINEVNPVGVTSIHFTFFILFHPNMLQVYHKYGI